MVIFIQEIQKTHMTPYLHLILISYDLKPLVPPLISFQLHPTESYELQEQKYKHHF